MTKANHNHWQDQLASLDQLLCQTEQLWREQPFKVERPQWCEYYPQLCDALLALDDSQLADLNQQPQQLLPWLAQQLPELGETLRQIEALSQIDNLEENELPAIANRFFDSVPGRKRAQIEAFTSTLGTVKQPVIEWCGGKGFLGRLMGQVWQQPVTTLEWDQQLCRAGEELAQKHKIDQQFYVQDVLQPGLPVSLTDKHAVALHACGELHRQLVRQGVAQDASRLDIAPCCYAVGMEGEYRPFNNFTQLKLQRDDLRLAVTEAVTAAPRELRQRDQDMAWKLAFNALRSDLSGVSYQALKPVPKAWLKAGFEGYCRKLAERERLVLPETVDWEQYRQQGVERQRAVMRLQLVRHGFRRAIECWLVLDLICWMQQQGYHVTLGAFCERNLTPRNLLISARREASVEAV